MKKFLLSLSVIVVFLLYALHQKNEQSTAIQTVGKPSIQPATPTVNASGQTTPTITQAVVVPTRSPQGQYKNGTYTGDVADAFYGNIQVQAVISGGKLSDVVFLQYPNDRGTSIEINTQAMPLLKQEAVAAQNANVDIVSGATDSSNAFRQSLDSALNQAKI